MENNILPLRTELADIKPYGAPQLEVPVCLNVNENPYSPSPTQQQAMLNALAKVLPDLNRYPSRDFPQLRQALAEYLKFETGVSLKWEQIWAGNGSNEVLTHILQAYAGPGRIVLGSDCSYSMYPEYCRVTHSRYITVPRQSNYHLNTAGLIAAIKKYRPSVVVVASPNNPTGEITAVEELERILRVAQQYGPQTQSGKKQALLVVDEAYAEFRPESCKTAVSLLESYPNLVISRTLSKSFAMAGLRLGYLAASEAVIYDLMRVRLPYHLSALSQAAAIAALDFKMAQSEQIKELCQRRQELEKWLIERGFTVADSDANFLLFGCFKDRHLAFKVLLEQGVLIREVGPDGFLRATIGTATEDAQLREALSNALVSGKIELI